MAKINSKVIFITTSPRTPFKIIPEIALLQNHFSGQCWNSNTQKAFMELLREENFFHGKGAKDPAFSARDRINRAPKALGLVTLTPTVQLTRAGEELISSRRKEEIFLKQLLKFQIPSPFHEPSENSANFFVKPYLEIFRLIKEFNSLTFDELMMFGLQIVDYRLFDVIVEKINKFRTAKVLNKGNYKHFQKEYFENELREIYSAEISEGKTKTRETNDTTVAKFLKTKASNMRDYADACFRYLRATGMINISYSGKSISFVPENIRDIDYFLQNTDRNPCFVDDKEKYVNYLGNPQIPKLLTDNREILEQKIRDEFPLIKISAKATLQDIKDIYADALENRKKKIISNQVAKIKNRSLFDEIIKTFKQIIDKSLYDVPLMLEWNTWRAMTMLNGGNIKANLKFDDYGNPMSTAQGNMADIVCDYGSFGLTVEVTMQSGQRQYESEGEPVARHLAKYKREVNKPVYCLFIAPNINEACTAYFYTLHKTNIQFYGGTLTIVPLPLNIFIEMIKVSYNANYFPEPKHVKRFFERSNELVKTTDNEIDWYKNLSNIASNWLTD
jgi:hypothetical protein